MRAARLVLMVLLVVAAARPVTGVHPTEPADAPTIWRIYPVEAGIAMEAGAHLVFQAGASDADCDLRWFDWGDGSWLDPVSGCDAESSFGVTAPEVAGTYLLTVAIVDWQGNSALTQWEISVSTPVEPSSWGRVKALFR